MARPDAPEMNLPPGKTCGDCFFYERCKGFFGCPATNDNCDWSPSRFKQRVAIATVSASNSHAMLIAEVVKYKQESLEWQNLCESAEAQVKKLQEEVKKLTEEADANAREAMKVRGQLYAAAEAALKAECESHGTITRALHEENGKLVNALADEQERGRLNVLGASEEIKDLRAALERARTCTLTQRHAWECPVLLAATQGEHKPYSGEAVFNDFRITGPGVALLICGGEFLRSQQVHEVVAALNRAVVERDRLWCKASLALDPKDIQVLMETFNKFRDTPTRRGG